MGVEREDRASELTETGRGGGIVDIMRGEMDWAGCGSVDSGAWRGIGRLTGQAWSEIDGRRLYRRARRDQ